MIFSAILDKTLRVYRANFAPLIAVSLVAGVVQLPLLLLLETKPAPGTRETFPWGSLGLILLVTPVAAIVVHAAFGRMMMGIYVGERIGFRQAYRAVLARLPTLLVTAFLSMAAAAAGLVLLVVPGIYIALGFSLSHMAIMAEGATAMRALKRSWELVDGLRGRVFALLCIWGVLNMVLGFAVGGVLQLFGTGSAEMLRQLSNQLVAVFVMPCSGLSLGILYFSVLEEREGHDLALAAQRLPGASAPTTGRPRFEPGRCGAGGRGPRAGRA